MNYIELTLFKDKQHLSIVYGRNGSGKTTIAKAIRQLVGKDTEQPTEEGYVYDYAKNPTVDEEECVETGIENVMRRVIEAFSSFCYNMKFEEMMCREGVLKAVPDKKRKYYENFMCRLALNGESHMEERVYDLNTITPYFTKQEKAQTTKSLLLFQTEEADWMK